MSTLTSAALLALVEEAGTGVATLAEGLDEADLRRSRLTRAELLRLLRVLAHSLGAMPLPVRQDMPELDWEGWRGVAQRLQVDGGEALEETLWFSVSSLVPATLLWLRVYRQSHPALFAMRP